VRSAHGVTKNIYHVNLIMDCGFDKKTFITEFIDAYISKYITTNIYLHTEFYKSIKHIAKLKKEDQMIVEYEKVKYYMLHQNGLEVIRIEEPQEVSETILTKIIYSSAKEFHGLASLKSTLQEKPYAVLNYLYWSLIDSRNLEEIYLCVKYLLGLKKKELVGKNQEIYILDVVFNLLIYIAKVLDPHIHKFIQISHELIYFRCVKKNILDRVRILYACVWMLFHRKVDKTKLCKFEVKQPRDERLSYLYVICEKDAMMQRMIEKDRECEYTRTLQERRRKVVNAEGLEQHISKRVSIVKSHGLDYLMV
jgi:hypothetical protein